MAVDPVNPTHYSDLGEYAAIHVITKWGLGFELGNALKYIQRAGLKEGNSALTDLEKAEWYIRRELHIMDPAKHDCPSGVNILPRDEEYFVSAYHTDETACDDKGPDGWHCERAEGHDGLHWFPVDNYPTAAGVAATWEDIPL